jgi:hypothetical protein
MKALFPSVVLATLATIVVASSAEEDPKRASPFASSFRERGSILGIDLKAIQVALPIFEKHGLKVEGYKVIVIEDREFVVVVFDDPQRPSGQMGSTARMVSFEVRLKRSDLSLVSSNFVR